MEGFLNVLLECFNRNVDFIIEFLRQAWGTAKLFYSGTTRNPHDFVLFAHMAMDVFLC